ncbi:hypothetical protein [Opitutus terrae]|uniref:Uncharacterized protein n=1 Tax=Opitutus terrae (strain DSM 11246 / JCM 15787 / PB90-1) TaxID=452637 RepID=B1ZST3_OPITP|nr:hypothetical protein [Opitutus terrae]ACB74777.1 hypothetical protein Oter_1493 [Opitutus terrae PB90-1]
MKTRVLLLLPLTSLLASQLFSQPQPTPEPPVPVTQAQPPTNHLSLLTPPQGENQRLYGSRQATLIAPEAARQVSERFRAAYGQAASPRIVIYVNRALADTDSGLKLTGRTEKIYESTNSGKDGEPAKSNDRSTENTYAATDAAKPTLADQQTVREVERLFGRVFRNAGARLADARAAAALLGEQTDLRLGGEQAAQERAALKQVADIAVEILISSRDLTVARVSGDATYKVPDIQATAIRLSDAAILGQAAASEVLGQGSSAGQVVQYFGVPDITEATAFVLMEDMLTDKPAPAALPPTETK